MNTKGQTTTLIVCVLGLYGSFITWSILQEKINTKPYFNEGVPEFFKAPLVVNMVQSLFAIFVSLLHSIISKNANPFQIFTRNDKQIRHFYFKKFILISLTSSLAAPIGYQSLRHVDYLVFLLSKSCKLIPVMLVHFVFYRTKFPLYKYVVALSVTAGVIIFTLGNSKKKQSSNDGKTIIGLGQLLLLMLLDGLTNSTQDQLFKQQNKWSTKFKVDGSALMCVLNTFMLFNTFVYTFGFTQEIQYTINFISKYPQAAVDILSFAALGSVGQIFVFIILEKFDSLILTTATVTRKMLSMVLSVILFGHLLNTQQIMGVICVFFGIGYEAFVKSPKPKKD